ncbi:retrovirus-related pol polyprotein from transposon TNT 1-94 [Tanacetum coccineum]
MYESPLVDLGFAIPVFSPGDDPITCLNKEMAFLTAVASLRFPSTNNQLRTSSNPRNQATIQDGRVTMKQVQGRQGQSYSGMDLDTYDSDCDDISKQQRFHRPKQFPTMVLTLFSEVPHSETYLNDMENQGYHNPFYLRKAQRIKPTLYDGIDMSSKHVAMPVIDDEETLILEEESRSKMSEKEKDPEAIKQNISHKPIDYEKFNRLSDDFGKQAPKELPKVSLVNESLKKLKFHLARFNNVMKIRTTPDARTEDLLNEIMEVQTVFDQMDAAVQQFSVDKQCLEIAKKELLLENDRLLQQIMSQYVLLTVMNSISLIDESLNAERKRNESCDKCFNLEAELLKLQNAHNDLLKSYSQLEKHCISLELSIQLNQEFFQKDESCNNQNALEILEFFENNDLKDQLQDKDNNICMFKLDLEPLAPRLLQNREIHTEYLKYTQEQADILRGIVKQAKAKQPLDKELDFACKHAQRIQELLVYVQDTCPNAIKVKVKKVRFAEPLTSSSHIKQVESSKILDSNTPVLSSTRLKCSTSSSKKAKIVESKNANHSEPNHTWGSNATDIPSSSSLVMTGTVRIGNDHIARIIGFLRTKDEAPEAIIKCIKNIQVRLNATVRNVRTDNGTEFVNQTLCEFYENVGISHQTSVARTPQQNGVVKRQNQTLVEVARTTLIFSKATLFLWAKAINTACYTQNRSLIRLRYNKTPYELMQDKKPDLSFFHVFGALCYPTNDNDDLGLVPNPVSQKPCIPPKRDDWDRLFQPMFDEYFNPPSIDVSPVQEAIAPRAMVLANFIVSTSIDLDTPSSKSPKTPIFRDDPLHESLHEESTSQGSSSNVRQTHTLFEHLGKWNKDHPISNVIGDPSRSVSTRKQLQTDAMWCYFDAFLTLHKCHHMILNGLPKWRRQTTFLNGELKEEVYVSQLEVFVDQEAKKGPLQSQTSTMWHGATTAVQAFLISTTFIQRGKTVNATLYHGMIGSLMYLTSSRPDLIYAICLCARYKAKPTEKHLNVVKRIFRHLKGTINMGLWYSKDTSMSLTAYADADHARCQDTRRSTSGSDRFLGDKLVSWSSNKQKSTVISSTKAEYIALSGCCAQILWMR